jgi:hypothetical protein
MYGKIGNAAAAGLNFLWCTDDLGFEITGKGMYSHIMYGKTVEQTH